MTHYHRNGDAVVVMGNIGYPIDTDQLKLKDENSELANLACANLLLEMPLGEVEISASREGLTIYRLSQFKTFN